MAVLDTILEMQRQGMQESEMVNYLRNQGVSPKEINDALNQAKIKSAVSQSEEQLTQTPQQDYQAQQNPSYPQQEQPPYPNEQQNQQQDYSQAQQEQYNQQQQPEVYPPEVPQQTPQEQQDPSYDYYQQTPQAYPGQEGYYMPSSTAPLDTETISEIAEQVASEKIAELQKKLGDITSFKNAIQDKVTDLDQRLKRIESSIDKLHHAVVGKIGEFGENAETIHKDLNNLHNSVSKLMNPLIDNINEMKKAKKK
jgi:DNA-binding transcriptional MerR regulator